MDVIVVGAGPAGAVAATVLARAGVRVRLVDRAAFPREKLCGDTVNPGTLAMLRRLRLADAADTRGVRVAGMRVTGGDGVAIEGRYPRGLRGAALRRCELDHALVAAAVGAGAAFEPLTPVRAVVERDGGVAGVRVGTNGGSRELRAPVTIAADGRHSTLAFALGVARHPLRPRRSAIGAYFADVAGMSDVGEMHIRGGHYIGVAPLPDRLANVCLVKPFAAGDAAMRDPLRALIDAVAADAALRERFAAARAAGPAVVLGPLAVDMVPEARVPDGLLLAGDAAGFVDPMTGDGLRFAIRGGELAAAAAIQALEHGWSGVQRGLAVSRRQEFGPKWRFNRALRALVDAPRALRLATSAATLAPSWVAAMIARAGDCDLA